MEDAENDASLTQQAHAILSDLDVGGPLPAVFPEDLYPEHNPTQVRAALPLCLQGF